MRDSAGTRTDDTMYCKRCGKMIIKNLNYRTDGFCLGCRIAIYDQQFNEPPPPTWHPYYWPHYPNYQIT